MDHQAHTWRTWRQASAIVLTPWQLRPDRDAGANHRLGVRGDEPAQRQRCRQRGHDYLAQAAMTALAPLLVSNFGVLSATRAKPHPTAADGR